MTCITAKTTILVKTVGTVPAFPPPPITMLIISRCPKSRVVHRSIARMFQHCLGEGGWGGGARKRQRKKSTRCSYNDGTMYSKFSTFRPNFRSVPKSFDQDYRSSTTASSPGLFVDEAMETLGTRLVNIRQPSASGLRTVPTIVIAHTLCDLEILGFPICDAY